MNLHVLTKEGTNLDDLLELSEYYDSFKEMPERNKFDRLEDHNHEDNRELKSLLRKMLEPNPFFRTKLSKLLRYLKGERKRTRQARAS